MTIAGWVLIVLLLTVPGNPWEEPSKERLVHAIPFEELFQEVQDDDPRLLIVVGEMIGNLFLLFPLGLLLPLRWPSMASLGRLVMGVGLLALAVEAIQFGLGLGRRASATDVLLNTLGAVLGFATLVLLQRLRRRQPGPSSPSEPQESV